MMKKKNLRTITRPDQTTERAEGIIICNCSICLLGADSGRGAIEEAGLIRLHCGEIGNKLNDTTALMCRNDNAIFSISFEDSRS